MTLLSLSKSVCVEQTPPPTKKLTFFCEWRSRLDFKFRISYDRRHTRLPPNLHSHTLTGFCVPLFNFLGVGAGLRMTNRTVECVIFTNLMQVMANYSISTASMPPVGDYRRSLKKRLKLVTLWFQIAPYDPPRPPWIVSLPVVAPLRASHLSRPTRVEHLNHIPMSKKAEIQVALDIALPPPARRLVEDQARSTGITPRVEAVCDAKENSKGDIFK